MLKKSKRRRTIIAGAIGEDVHVAGVLNFLKLADKEDYKTIFLGPAISIKTLVDAIKETDADFIGVSYRIMPESGEFHLEQLKMALEEAGLLRKGKKYIFGGTPPVAKVAREIGIFEKIFDGTDPIEDIIAYLRGGVVTTRAETYPDNVVDRIRWKKPFPLIRHHIGLPSLEETIVAVEKVAKSKVVDIVSLAPDQDAQENFFHPEKQDPRRKGAGGVPVRTSEDLERIYAATRCGNFPLMRCYQGTSDLFKTAEMLLKTIKNCFAAIPIFWFSTLDKRGPLGLEEAIREHQALMKWHAERGVPVELNEPHHFELRESSDVVAVADAFLAAYNAKKMGVRDFISTYMFDLPMGESFDMDLAKQFAKKEIIEGLVDEEFIIHRQTRTGLLRYPADLNAAKGRLATSVMLQMALKPEIIHVVSYVEAHHAASAEDVIESCKIARYVIHSCIEGMPDMSTDLRVQQRKSDLVSEAKVLLNAITRIAPDGTEDPLSDPETLGRAVRIGLLDAPHLKGSEIARGAMVTKVINGACYAVDPRTGKPISEQDRIRRILKDLVKMSNR
jgi:methylmalonyl-CoA mutase cobalamin-binding subunit